MGYGEFTNRYLGINGFGHERQGSSPAARAAAAAAARWAKLRGAAGGGEASAPRRRAAGGQSAETPVTPTTPYAPPKPRSTSEPESALKRTTLAPPPRPSPSATKIANEHVEWADRCSVQPARPGEPCFLTIFMAEVGLDDALLVRWCSWMDRRLTAERPNFAGGSQFKASTIDFSENAISVKGMKALFDLLEKHRVRCEVLRLSGNHIGNEGLRRLAKYLASSSQAPVQELLLTKNRFSMEGVIWLLGSLALHPAYPVWNASTERFVPLWLRLENSRATLEARRALAETCERLCFAVCLGERTDEESCGPRKCVNAACSDQLKHNCVAHLSATAWKGEAALPPPAIHARSFFSTQGLPEMKASNASAAGRREEPQLLYEDEDMAVVLKPSGWSCTPQPEGVDPSWVWLAPAARRVRAAKLLAQESAAPLQGWLLLQFGHDPACDVCRDQTLDRGLVHRLDVETSGPMLVGKTHKGYEHARNQILLGVLKDASWGSDKVRFAVWLLMTILPSAGEADDDVDGESDADANADAHADAAAADDDDRADDGVDDGDDHGDDDNSWSSC
eukprot:s347_g1.t1